MADRSVCIGGPKPQESYLDARRILAAASALGVDAIHPGYGFLSENADFADLVEAEGFIFVGPTGASIRAMGDKATARKLAEEAGVPTTRFQRRGGLGRGSGSDCRAHRLSRAVEGVGGRRRARNAGCQRSVDDREAFLEASREATIAFGNGAMYLEKFLTDIRHIEIQVLGDGHNILHLGERDCSSQRRNQKLVEESPSPVLSAAARADRRGGGPPVQARELSKRRHDRVHSRSRIAALLLHGNEHADPGRASCHRNGLRH